MNPFITNSITLYFEDSTPPLEEILSLLNKSTGLPICLSDIKHIPREGFTSSEVKDILGSSIGKDFNLSKDYDSEDIIQGVISFCNYKGEQSFSISEFSIYIGRNSNYPFVKVKLILILQDLGGRNENNDKFQLPFWARYNWDDPRIPKHARLLF